jgi:hypothetical protein
MQNAGGAVAPAGVMRMRPCKDLWAWVELDRIYDGSLGRKVAR